MNRLKYLSVVLFAAILVGVSLVACDDDKDADPKAEGKKAGTEMCSCVDSVEPPTDLSGFEAYAGQLFECLGVLTPYKDKEYFDFAGTYEERYGYDAEADEPLYSIFNFVNSEFGNGFKEATNDCMQEFATLFAMMQ